MGMDPSTGGNTNDVESSGGMSTNLAQKDDSVVDLEESNEEEDLETKKKVVDPKKGEELVVENESEVEEQASDSVVENEPAVQEQPEETVENSQQNDEESLGGASTNYAQYFLSTTPEDYSKVFTKNG